MSPDPVTYDAVEIGLGRLATEYSESSTLKAYLTALLTGLNSLEQVVNDLALRRTLDESYGVTLDIIGEIVGQPRFSVAIADNPFFGFWDGTTPNEYLGFSTDGVVDGGRFWNGEALDGQLLSDAEYLAYIKARIVRNIAKGTHPDMLAAFKFILGEDTVIDIQDAAAPGTITIGISRPINDAEQFLLTSSGLTPRPAGVGIQQWYTYVPTFALGLSDSVTGYFPTGSKGLGDYDAAGTYGWDFVTWTSNTVLAGIDWWVRPNNGYDYFPSRTGSGETPLTAPQEPKWVTDPAFVDLRVPGYPAGTTFDIEGIPDWLPNTVYADQFRIRPSNGHPDRLYRCEGGGTSGSTPPVWPETPMATFTDGTITWKAVNLTFYLFPVLDPRNGGILASAFE